MKAVVLREFGAASNLRMESVPMPRPGRGEVLVHVRACGVCYHDVINRRGNLPRTHVPAILGHEAAGEVVEVGPDTPGWKIGDRVATLQRLSCGECALCRSGRNSLCRKDNRFFGEELPGGYAQFMVAPVAGLGRVPDNMAWEVAATACCTTGTAVHTVRTRGQVKPGETVLITGASGGVGLSAVQLAKEDGARVIAVTSSEAKVQALHEAGAAEVIVSRGLDFAAEVRRRTAGEGVNVAVEIVGSATFEQSLKSMAPGGRVVVVGNLESGVVNLNPGLVIVKELEILGAYATTLGELDEALRLTASGKIRPFVSEAMALAEAGRSHFRLENREVAGRLVLIPPEA
ncbi:alcohol dehydrogenase catalytic domain-containing protein [Hyalangium rubrum]|uniref:Alcohol dehydrogenase catalytic domain-containing protein n=1 Tax=Hyalangium rubrum TaxID=3103134 RepID=A0ABU5GUT8_9BACT|nr:alcohol dehydrogenase catalytic domain-containing protein [Hyalangium sp. s54d21]MDY7224948.1 alcohol dehydrogenase catalytic domain-containing protein [Hyalangium sp. s54d21]